MSVGRTSTTWLAMVVSLAILPAASAQVAAGRRPYAATKYGGNYMHNYLVPPAPSATPWLPEWSPDGEWIAVSMGGAIWRVDLDGKARELVAGPKYYSSPAISPDGRWLAYTADDGGRSVQLEAMELSSGRIVALTSDAQNYLDPRWSPDGRRLAYTASLPNGFLNVFLRPVSDGAFSGEAEQVTDDSSFGKDRPYFTAQDMHITPAWDASGDTLVLVSNRGVALGSGNIVRVPARAGGMAHAMTVFAEQTLYHARPHVSPDGRTVVYSSAMGGTQHAHDLFTVPLGGGRPTRLTSLPYDAWQPRWSPDGRRIAFISNRSGVPQLAIFDVQRRQVRDVSIRGRQYKRPMARVTLRVVDARGALTPARVHVLASDGKFHAPADAFARLDWMNDRVFHASGVSVLTVPAGSLKLEAVKGFEHRPARIELTVAPGEDRTITLVLERLADMAAMGWYGGTTGVHMHDAGALRYSLEAIGDMAAAEDIRFVANPLAHHDDRITGADLWVPGRKGHRASTRQTLLTLGQEHRPGFYGHVAVFGMARRLPSLYRVTVGYEGNPGPSLGVSNTDVLGHAHREGAFTAYVHAFAGEDDPMRAGLGLGKALLVDAALGVAHGLEWASAGRGAFLPWYALLNNGFRIVALGGDDTIANMYIMRMVGSVRTYVACPAGLSADAWWEGLRKGRAFVTTGPLVNLEIDGQGIGGDVALPAGGGTVKVRAWVRSITPLQKVILVHDGETVAEFPLVGERTTLDTTLTMSVRRSGWVHLRAEGSSSERHPLDALYAQALTNPTWLTVGGQAPRDSASAEYALKWIDMLQLMADAWPGWESSTEKAHVFGQFDQARSVFRTRMADANGRRAAPVRP